MQLATITSQGQISIPVNLLRLYGFKKPSKVLAKPVAEGILIEPIKDIFDYAGFFKSSKKYSQKKVDEGFATYMGNLGASLQQNK